MLHSDMLAIAAQANITTMLVGLPGIGKTAIARSIQKAIEDRLYNGTGYPLVLTNAAQSMPEDLGGAQVPNHETRTMDAYAMGAIKAFIAHKRGIHLIDEYGSCSGAMRAACLSVTEGRQYGDHHLPGVFVVCCMNPPEIATNGSDMTPPESNRFFWLDWKLDDSVWFDYMRGGEGAVESYPVLPKDWADMHMAKCNSLIVSFLKRNPKHIHEMPAPENATGPWPSNRSWENAAKMFAAVRACGMPMASDHVHAAVAGCVGKAVADVFFAWVKDMDLPDPEDMLAATPEEAFKMIPSDRHHRAIVCLESMASAACEKNHKDLLKRWNKAWEILTPVIKQWQDRAEPAARILSKNKPNGGKFPDEAGMLLKIRRDIGASTSGVVS
jgi:hypothetical protein